MKYVNLLLARSGLESLNDFVGLFFKIVDVQHVQERQSDHYSEGRYFLGTRGELTYSVMRSDDPDHADLPYWVQISGSDDGRIIEEEVDALIERCMHQYDMRVARVENFGRIDERRIDCG